MHTIEHIAMKTLVQQLWCIHGGLITSLKSAPRGDHTLIGLVGPGPASFPSYKADLGGWGCSSAEGPEPDRVPCTLPFYYTILYTVSTLTD